uniref:Reelin domain-containing protein n=1 Tax=Hucho hucho TaxID=62062 RepID=A0A4W5LWS7_9TELE
MARASFGGALSCTLLALVLAAGMDLGSPPAAGFYPHFNPFFFLCTHHGELEGSGVAEGGGEVLLTLQIAGDPTHYTPGQEYQGDKPGTFSEYYLRFPLTFIHGFM